MIEDPKWRQNAGCARSLMADNFANGMGSFDRVEPRMAAALQDILTRPGSLVRAVTAYLIGIEMGVAMLWNCRSFDAVHHFALHHFAK